MTAPVPNDVRHKAHKQTWKLHCVLVADVENTFYPVHIISYYPAKMKRADLKLLAKCTPMFFFRVEESASKVTGMTWKNEARLRFFLTTDIAF